MKRLAKAIKDKFRPAGTTVNSTGPDTVNLPPQDSRTIPPSSPSSRVEAPKTNISFKVVNQIFRALMIGVQGIALEKMSNPARKTVGLSTVGPVQKDTWNFQARREFQEAVEKFEPKTSIARNQKAIVLRNNPNWDTDGHPFAASSIPHFLAQLESLNSPYQNPGQTMLTMLALENEIIRSFYKELGEVDGRAASILHTVAAKPSTARLMLMYAPDDSHDADNSRKEEEHHQKEEHARREREKNMSFHAFGSTREEHTSYAALSTVVRKRDDDDTEENKQKKSTHT